MNNIDIYWKIIIKTKITYDIKNEVEYKKKIYVVIIII